MKKLALSTYITALEDLFSTLPLYGESSVENLELWGDLEYHFNLNQTNSKKLVKKLKKFQIKITAYHYPYLFDLSLFDEKERKKNVALAKEFIDCLEILGGEILVIHGSTQIEYLPYREEKLEKSLASLEEIISYAELKKKKIALENHLQTFLFSKREEILEVLARFPSPFFGLCFDLGHFNLTSDPIEEIAYYQGRIFNFHLSDNEGKDDDHLFPGEGVINWSKFFEVVERINYQGLFTLEVKNTPAWPEKVKEFMQRWKKYSRLIVNELADR
jgi:sugar phosphate isomerase/epimerase